MAEFITKCPHCSTDLQAQEEWIGMEVECPICLKKFFVDKPTIQIRKPVIEMENSVSIKFPSKKKFFSAIKTIIKIIRNTKPQMRCFILSFCFYLAFSIVFVHTAMGKSFFESNVAWGYTVRGTTDIFGKREYTPGDMSYATCKNTERTTDNLAYLIYGQKLDRQIKLSFALLGEAFFFLLLGAFWNNFFKQSSHVDINA